MLLIAVEVTLDGSRLSVQSHSNEDQQTANGNVVLTFNDLQKLMK